MTFLGQPNRLSFNLSRQDGSAVSEDYDGVNDGTWHHYAFTRRAATLKWYRDGLVTKTDSNDCNDWPFSRAGNSISGQGPPNANKFAISDFKVFPADLTDSQIAGLLKAEI